ncbi:MAG TPA: preprotein translocase subunit YajC [Tepidiformaceae bacterium]|nr:preprotein translocase subunit YajC [Tepidiformaceae bacterium]
MAVMWSVIFYTGLAVAAFYFILLQPVLKKNKERSKAVQSLQIGDEVVTTGGIIGEVLDVVTPPDGPTEIILQIAPDVKIRALTEAIDRRLTTLEPEEDKPEVPEANSQTDPATPTEVSRTSA